MRYIFFIVLLFFLIPNVAATVITGTIYNEQFEPEENVIVEINTTPKQKFLSTDGNYRFEVPPGYYVLEVYKGLLSTKEELHVVQEGTFRYDLFLLPDVSDEDLWQETTGIEFIDAEEKRSYAWWRYLAAGLIFALLLIRLLYARKKYGSLWKFRKRIQTEQKKPLEQAKKEITPNHLEQALEIIKRHDGRITQKDLRKAMLYLSEAKVSLIVAELEFKGRIDKIKKGRGNIIILKS